MLTEMALKRRMIANLKPGDRIRFPATDLQTPTRPIPRTNRVCTTVVGVNRLMEGWHEVETEVGILKPQAPTNKYELAEPN